jgi:hypothetical protein
MTENVLNSNIRDILQNHNSQQNDNSINDTELLQLQQQLEQQQQQLKLSEQQIELEQLENNFNSAPVQNLTDVKVEVSNVKNVSKFHIVKELKKPLLLFMLFIVLNSDIFINILNKVVPFLGSITFLKINLGLLFRALIFILLYIVINKYVLFV